MDKRTSRSRYEDDNDLDHGDDRAPPDSEDEEQDEINGFKDDEDEPEPLDDLVKLKWQD